MTKRIDMSNNNKKVTITKGKKPLDGIEFNKRVDPKWRKKFDKLSREFERAKGHTRYCVMQAEKCEHAYDKSIDSMQRAKWKLEMDHWHKSLDEARKELSQISREFSEHQERS